MTHEIPGYVYSGDLDIENGGAWYGIDYDTLGHVIEYVSSADYDGAGFVAAYDVVPGWTLRERIARLRQAFGSGCGWTGGDRASRRAGAIAALHQYGYHDPANHYPDYHMHEFTEEPSAEEIIERVESYAR